MRGVFLDLATVDHDDIDLGPLERVLEPLLSHAVTAKADIVGHIGDAEVAISNKVVLDADTIAAAPDLKLICLAATGFNNVDIDAAREHDIAVCNIRGYCTASVAQHALALILALNSHLKEYAALLRDGAWRESPQFTMLDFPIMELTGRKLGIVGYGELGGAVAKLGHAFGMEVLVAARPGTEPSPGRIALESLLPQVDVLSLHCPLTDATRGLIGERELAAMQPHALLINTARGALVDEAALAKALRGGRLGGAGIDVLSEEPPVHGSPLLADDIPNLILTPHIAWAAREARQRAVDEIAENIRAFRAGTPRNRVV